jgi:transposase InsO family protein
MGQRAVGVDLKLAAVLAGDRSGMSVRALCAELGIHPDTYYEAKKRFDADGVIGLLPRSRRPSRSPTQTPPEVEDTILRARKELADLGWPNGARSISYRMARQGLAVPAVATIHRVLRRQGLIIDQPQKRPKSATRRFEFAERNGCWQMDGTHWQLAGGQQVVIIGAVDDHTRLALAHLAAPGETSDAVWACFLLAASRHGLPAMMLTDNGLALNATRRGHDSAFTTNLRALGVKAISSRPLHPQTCGKRERLNATLKHWLKKQPPAATMAQLQAQLDMFDGAYNDRPHQGLGGATPRERAATAAVAGPHAQPPAPARVGTVTVDHAGSVCSTKYLIGVGRRYAGLPVTVLDYGTEVSIFDGNQLIRTTTIDPTRRYQPTGDPRTGRRHPRIMSERNQPPLSAMS